MREVKPKAFNLKNPNVRQKIFNLLSDRYVKKPEVPAVKEAATVEQAEQLARLYESVGYAEQAEAIRANPRDISQEAISQILNIARHDPERAIQEAHALSQGAYTQSRDEASEYGVTRGANATGMSWGDNIINGVNEGSRSYDELYKAHEKNLLDRGYTPEEAMLTILGSPTQRGTLGTEAEFQRRTLPFQYGAQGGVQGAVNKALDVAGLNPIVMAARSLAPGGHDERDQALRNMHLQDEVQRIREGGSRSFGSMVSDSYRNALLGGQNLTGTAGQAVSYLARPVTSKLHALGSLYSGEMWDALKNGDLSQAYSLSSGTPMQNMRSMELDQAQDQLVWNRHHDVAKDWASRYAPLNTSPDEVDALRRRKHFENGVPARMGAGGIYGGELSRRMSDYNQDIDFDYSGSPQTVDDIIELEQYYKKQLEDPKVRNNPQALNEIQTRLSNLPVDNYNKGITRNQAVQMQTDLKRMQGGENVLTGNENIAQLAQHRSPTTINAYTTAENALQRALKNPVTSNGTNTYDMYAAVNKDIVSKPTAAHQISIQDYEKVRAPMLAHLNRGLAGSVDLERFGGLDDVKNYAQQRFGGMEGLKTHAIQQRNLYSANSNAYRQAHSDIGERISTQPSMNNFLAGYRQSFGSQAKPSGVQPLDTRKAPNHSTLTKTSSENYDGLAQSWLQAYGQRGQTRTPAETIEAYDYLQKGIHLPSYGVEDYMRDRRPSLTNPYGFNSWGFTIPFTDVRIGAPTVEQERQPIVDKMYQAKRWQAMQKAYANGALTRQQFQAMAPDNAYISRIGATKYKQMQDANALALRAKGFKGLTDTKMDTGLDYRIPELPTQLTRDVKLVNT